ncbi:SDR family NAD(P)-dependent oxidoreductase [Sphingobium sp. KCTC 72723]|jgi:3(or 17)beta-hydroxysteroid dehydrogenase|uniref:SDR family NAD(P)-dependent oxidoreductase n=1 Tax=Sphingobium sp. KCTC 72723 TaxID=2733867 RepID=UPI00165D9A6F|nr:SDR family oxidoreductase [Sphingobium sp. KCTC 72723]
MGRVNGKRILVTGGGSGLGAAFVTRLAEEGARLFIADIDMSSGEALARATGGTFLPLDVSDEDAWVSAIATVERDAGGLDGLVNNAGLASSKGGEDIETIDLTDLHRIFAVNVDGTILGCKHAIPLMSRSGGGSIVNLSSIAALIPAAFVVSYGASKATVAHLTRSIAMHCAGKGQAIRCNSVHPGQVRTAMMESIIARMGQDTNMGQAKAEQTFLDQIPLRKFQEAIDIANAVLFLLSDEARFITGTQLIVDGGMTLSN